MVPKDREQRAVANLSAELEAENEERISSKDLQRRIEELIIKLSPR